MNESFDIKYWYLRDHRLFRTLNSIELKQLCISAIFKKANKNEILHFSESNVPRVFFLKKGAVKLISIDENGNELIRDIIQKGDLFGELYLDLEKTNLEMAKVASNEVIICSFLLSDFENLMKRRPDLALNYIKFLGLKFKRIQNNYNNLVNKDVKERFKLFLLEWIEKEGKQDGNHWIIDNYLTHEDIAQIICTSRQTASKLLKTFEKSNIIEYNRKHIVIKDVTKLK